LSAGTFETILGAPSLATVDTRMDILHKIAEQRLREAIEAGHLDDYAGKGEPLELDDLSGVPEDLRAGYVLLKNAGFLPEEMDLRKEVLKLGDLIAACHDDGVRRELVERRDSTSLRLALLLERRGAGAAWSEYGAGVLGRLTHQTGEESRPTSRASIAPTPSSAREAPRE
jgi:hypothetical protein